MTGPVLDSTLCSLYTVYMILVQDIYMFDLVVKGSPTSTEHVFGKV
jgi:hypothetical protein